MNNSNNNILSYFIKDIKDATERAFYKKITNRFIEILYKDKLLYEIHKDYCNNFIRNISKSPALKYILKSNIAYDYITKVKYLYYKNDNKIKNYNPNFIKFSFLHNKYLNSTCLFYISYNKTLLSIKIIYSNIFKYIIISNLHKNKFTSPHILISNKYELDYYCKFFNLYFAYN